MGEGRAERRSLYSMGIWDAANEKRRSAQGKIEGGGLAGAASAETRASGWAERTCTVARGGRPRGGGGLARGRVGRGGRPSARGEGRQSRDSCRSGQGWLAGDASAAGCRCAQTQAVLGRLRGRVGSRPRRRIDPWPDAPARGDRGFARTDHARPADTAERTTFHHRRRGSALVESVRTFSGFAQRRAALLLLQFTLHVEHLPGRPLQRALRDWGFYVYSLVDETRDRGLG